MQIYLFALILFGSVMVLLLGLMMIQPLREKLKKVVSAQVSEFLFNGLI